jgi:hypothetical protein
MLLTSSQVSLILSSTVVVICAIGIFLAGYVVQQNTVENLQSHEDVCDALILLHELYRSKSAAPKLLLFPRTWIREQNGADPIDEVLEKSVSLLRKASRLYRAILVPIGPLLEDGDGESGSYAYRLLN